MYPSTSKGLENKSKSIDHIKHMQMIVSLLYLTTSRLDILFSICLCARF